MAEKSRSLSFFLFVCALLSGVIFYGCGGGGGTSSEHVPLQISGNITSVIPLANLRADSTLSPELRAASSLAGVEVYVESARELYSTQSDSDGKFLLSGVPAGAHYLVARVLTATGTTLKVRSSEAVIVSDSRPTAQAPVMSLIAATASASGMLVDISGNPMRNARLLLWGEAFYTDINGRYSTPPMPENIVASIVVAVPGYQQTAIEVKFTDNPPFIEQTIVVDSSTNRPPTSTLIASRYSVSPGVSVALTATAMDQDEQLGSSNYSWSAAPAIGTFSGAINDLKAVWVASEDGLATVTFTVTDNGGLRSRSSVAIVVGSGIRNDLPIITGLRITTTGDEVASNFYSGGNYKLVASAIDANGDSLTYTWSSSPSTSFTSTSGATVGWRAPATVGSVTITVTVKDSEGGQATRSLPVNVEAVPINNLPPAAPVIALPVAGQLIKSGDQVTFQGSATDPNEDLTESALAWSYKLLGAANYTDLTAGTDNFQYNLFAAPGTYTVRLLATDMYGASAFSTVNIRVNSSPTASIINPAPGIEHKVGDTINFQASVTDVEDGGSIATGKWLFGWASSTYFAGGLDYATSTLREGYYVVSFTASDSKDVFVTASLTVNIKNPGASMTIHFPETGKSVYLNEEITVFGSGSDSMGVAIESSTMEWKLGATTVKTGVDTFVASFTTVGEYTYMLSGRDSGGKTASVTATFYVNATPSVQIDGPASGTRFDLGETITLAATVTDPDPSDMPAASWTSRLNGVTTLIGSGNPQTVSNLASGSHLITCTVTDRFGIASSSEIMFLVNTLPVATITYSTVPYATGPSSRPVFLSTQPSIPVSFTVDSFDAEINGTVESYNDDNVKWFRTYNDVESQIGTGAATIDSLPVGISTITVKLYDSFYPAFADQASNSVSLQVHVWQSRSFPYATTADFLNPAVDISGEDPAALTITFNEVDGPADEPDRGSVRIFKYEEGLGIDYFDLADSNGKYHTATAPIVLTTISSAIDVTGKMLVLGANVGTGYLLRYEAIASYTGDTTANIGITNPLNISSDGSRLYICDSGAGAIRLLNPNNFEITNTVTEANDLAFLDLRKVRYSDETYGKVFVVDYGNNRVVRYGSELLGTALQPILVNNPIDAGFSKSYMLIMNDAGQVTVVEPNTGNTVMTFGASGDEAGEFDSPVAVYCSGQDLFVLESTRIQVIRSGVDDWLKKL